jgi:hypothetical protein
LAPLGHEFDGHCRPVGVHATLYHGRGGFVICARESVGRQIIAQENREDVM